MKYQDLSKQASCVCRLRETSRMGLVYVDWVGSAGRVVSELVDWNVTMGSR